MRDDNEPIGQDHKLVILNESYEVSNRPDSQSATDDDLHKAVPVVGDGQDTAREYTRSHT